MKYIALLLAYFFTAIILYLLGAFVAADFNIIHWDGYGRLVIGVIYLIVIGAFTGAILED